MKKYYPQKALNLFRLYEISYIDTDLILPLQTLGFILDKKLGKIHDLSGFICHNADYAVLVFQGTDLKDWKTIKEDLKFWKTKQDGVSYTDGFFDAYEKLYPEFKDSLNILGVDGKLLPLYIGGHSLGGAIALITALRLPVDSFEACYTAGAPRVCGLRGHALAEGKNIYKFIHENDIVPSLPEAVLGYWSPGQMVYITANDTFMTGWRAYMYRITAQIIPITRKGIFDLAEAAENFLTGDRVGTIKNVATFIKDTVFNVAGMITNHLIGNYIQAAENFNAKIKQEGL